MVTKLRVVFSWGVAAVAFAAGALAQVEMKLTEGFRVERVAAQDARLTLRTLAGAGETEIEGEHQIRVRDTPEKLLLVRKIVALLDRADTAAEPSASFEVGDGTTVASFALRHALPNEASRMLMGEIGIRRVATQAKIATVFVRDTPEQVEKALQLLRAFDEAASAASSSLPQTRGME